VSAQNTYKIGLLPSLNINKSLGNDWKLNLKIESRQILKEGIFKQNNDWNYNYLQTDFAFVGSKTLALNHIVAGGYMIRIRRDEIIHRFIQQYTYVKRYSSFRLAHRFSTDQTITQDEPTEYRIRYRITTEFPLNGTSVDVKEAYLKINNEYLNDFKGDNYDVEMRLIPAIGYKLTENNKVELGIDYRFDAFVDEGSRNRFFGFINWYTKL